MTAGRSVKSGDDRVVMDRLISKAVDPVAVIAALQQEIAQVFQ